LIFSQFQILSFKRSDWLNQLILLLGHFNATKNVIGD
jgi:hypothetical protein